MRKNQNSLARVMSADQRNALIVALSIAVHFPELRKAGNGKEIFKVGGVTNETKVNTTLH